MLPLARPHKEKLTAVLSEIRKRSAKREQVEDGGLLAFTRYFWPIVEPARPLIEGWPLEAICEHLEAVSRGEIKRLLINIPPGFMKSLCSNVFWPAWEWGPFGQSSFRYISASYSQALTLRDNVRFRNIIMSPEYQELWGDRFKPSKDQFNIVKVANDRTGWKLATSVGGIGTGERGDRFIIDDGNSVAEAESEAIRAATNQWFREVVPTRLNDARDGVIINIQQRTNEDDISGVILSDGLGYEHLCIPMEFDSRVPCSTCIGWQDPRTEDGELAWPARFPANEVADLKRIMGPYAVSGQFQQQPSPRGGGIFKTDWWQDWAPTDGKFPMCSYIVASLDPAYTSKEENDASGFTVWGVWHEQGNPKVILMHAWRKRLELHGQTMERLSMEDDISYARRTSQSWGLIEWVGWTCRKYKIDCLLVEAKASGLSVYQEIRRLYQHDGWGTILVDPKGADKVARAYAVQHLFADGLIHAPFEKEWATMVMDECASFPKAKHDDLVDSATQALKHLRDNGLIVRREERREMELADMAIKPPVTPLYDC